MSTTHRAPLSSEELSELRLMFSTLDHDGQGTIDATELTALMVTLGVPAIMSEVQALLQEVDTDGSGEIDFSEFSRVMTRKIDLPVSTAVIKEAFRVVAGADSPPGCISAEKLDFLLTRLGPLLSIPPDAEKLVMGYSPVTKDKDKDKTDKGRKGKAGAASLQHPAPIPAALPDLGPTRIASLLASLAPKPDGFIAYEEAVDSLMNTR